MGDPWATRELPLQTNEYRGLPMGQHFFTGAIERPLLYCKGVKPMGSPLETHGSALKLMGSMDDSWVNHWPALSYKSMSDPQATHGRPICQHYIAMDEP